MADKIELLHADVTQEIIGSFFDVYKTLGYGYLEAVYKKAMVVALGARGVSCVQEKLYTVQFLGQNVGDYRADLVVAGRVIVEVKTTAEILQTHQTQLYNYLKVSRLQVGLILNFGPKATYARHILTPNFQRPAKLVANT